MATWTAISDTVLEPGKPVRSVDGLALRDNPIAISEGAAGAPRIVNAAITNGTLGAEKFQAGTAERDWVLARCATASLGAVGTYALLGVVDTTAGPVAAGTTLAGSGLRYAHAGNEGNLNGTPSGTWRQMGYRVGGTTDDDRTTLWLRIS